jgi:hypothetical protein
MDAKDIPYLLQRARFHRGMERMTKCNEARCAHRQLVKNYQNRLLAIRRAGKPSIPVLRALTAASLPLERLLDAGR